MAWIQRTRNNIPTLPQGSEVASYRTYEAAQAAVDYLGEQDFPVENIKIVGTDLMSVETVMGKVSAGAVFFRNFLSGLWFGLLMGAMFALLVKSELGYVVIPLTMMAFGLLQGTVSVITYYLSPRRKDFASVTSVVASRYALLAGDRCAQARQLLVHTRGNLGVSAPKVVSAVATGATQFGSRQDEQPKFGVRLSPSERQARADERARQLRQDHKDANDPHIGQAHTLNQLVPEAKHFGPANPDSYPGGGANPFASGAAAGDQVSAADRAPAAGTDSGLQINKDEGEAAGAAVKDASTDAKHIGENSATGNQADQTK